MEEIKGVFFQDCRDLLGELETALLALKGGDRDPEIVNTAFRAVHSVKGGAANFALDRLAAFAHVFESAMAEFRAGRIEFNADSVDLMLRAADVVADHVEAERDGSTLDAERAQEIERALAALIDGNGASDFEIEATLEAQPDSHCWAIRIRPHAELYAKANETLFLLRELQRLGRISVKLNEDDIPLLQDLDAEQAYLSWDVLLHTTHGEEAIREIFEFVERECEFSLKRDGIEGPASEEAPAGVALAQDSVSSQAPPPTSGVDDGERANMPAAAKNAETIRVELERVERLVNLVSELVINQAMLTQHMAKNGNTTDEVDASLGELSQLTREIQDSVMAIRAQPVKSVFQRMSRLVREVEVATGKKVNLVIHGASTEVDRTVIEHLTDPLTHLVRNAIDHGIEAPHDRVARDKPAQGTLRLSAAHRSGRVVIEIADDGQGIDRERVRKIGVERGLITGDATLSDQEIDALIFMPGFSTAPQVSALSGRGVGMDVVKRGVHALGGRISIASTRGEGSTVTLSLPLTLAVLDGMIVTVGNQSLIAPLTALLETVQPKASDLHPLGANAMLMRFRGALVPLIDLGMHLGYRSEPLAPTSGIALVVEDDTRQCVALLVDEIQGQHQVVIKSLQANYRAVEGVAAATILGDGRVALILDVNAIIAAPRRHTSTAA
jgi:two-component system chemotaxis sensor kinase CheA